MHQWKDVYNWWSLTFYTIMTWKRMTGVVSRSMWGFFFSIWPMTSLYGHSHTVGPQWLESSEWFMRILDWTEMTREIGTLKLYKYSPQTQSRGQPHIRHGALWYSMWWTVLGHQREDRKEKVSSTEKHCALKVIVLEVQRSWNNQREATSIIHRDLVRTRKDRREEDEGQCHTQKGHLGSSGTATLFLSQVITGVGTPSIWHSKRAAPPAGTVWGDGSWWNLDRPEEERGNRGQRDDYQSGDFPADRRKKKKGSDSFFEYNSAWHVVHLRYDEKDPVCLM